MSPLWCPSTRVESMEAERPIEADRLRTGENLDISLPTLYTSITLPSSLLFSSFAPFAPFAPFASSASSASPASPATFSSHCRRSRWPSDQIMRVNGPRDPRVLHLSPMPNKNRAAPLSERVYISPHHSFTFQLFNDSNVL